MKRIFLLAGLLLASAAVAGEAQVGHEPRKSPYRDITKGKTISVVVGYFGGNGGSLGVGPHNGPTIGGRFDIKVSNTFQFGFSASQGDLERLIRIPPSDTSLVAEVSGPIPQSVLFFEVAAQLNFTGSKSWHRLAPYFSAVVGLAVAEELPADTSGFEFGNKLYLAPVLGTRVIVTQAVQLRLEARATFWKLSFPNLFSPDLSTGQWLLSPWFQAGLGISF